MFARGTGKAVVAVAVVLKVAQRHFLQEKLLGETNWEKPFWGNHFGETNWEKPFWGYQLGETILGKPFWGNQLGETILGKPFGGNHPRIPHFSHLTKLTRIMVTFRPLLHQWLKTRIKRILER